MEEIRRFPAAFRALLSSAKIARMPDSTAREMASLSPGPNAKFNVFRGTLIFSQCGGELAQCATATGALG